MDVSVIIVNYNTFELTCSCVESVIKFTEGISYEIILVDNASVECLPELFLEKFPAIKLLKSIVNTGFTGGNNLGVKIASGDTILLLNSDVVLTENSIAKCFQVLKGNTKIGIVSCMLKYPDGSIQRQCQRFPSILLTLIELFRIHKLIPQPKRGIIMGGVFWDHTTSIYSDSVWGAFFMFPKKVLDGFNNHQLPGEIFMYAEDLVWCYEIKKMGYTIYYNAETSVIHHMGASSAASVLNQKHQNEYDFVVKNYGWTYAKLLVFLRGILCFTVSSNMDIIEIRKIYTKLFLSGKVI